MWPARARADAPTRDVEVASSVGAGATGLPSIGSVAVASPRAPNATAAVSAGYGFTEAQGGETGSHHLFTGSVGAALQPLRFFAAAFTLDGLWQKHPADARGASSNAIGESRLLVRAAEAVGRSFALGAQLVWWLPGSTAAPSLRPGASTIDAIALATFAPPGSPFALAGNVGYRVDGSAKAIDFPERLRSGERVLLQTSAYSAFDAILLGVGGSERLGAIEVLGEIKWNVLVGRGAPSAIASPLGVGAGARYHANERIALELRGEVALSARPASGPLEPLAPMEPRLAVLAGFRWMLPFGAPPAGGGSELVKPIKPVAPPPAPVVGSAQGRVTSDAGEPLAGAHVTATTREGERTGETGADGRYTIADIPAGPARIVATATGFEEAAGDASINPRTSATTDLVLKRIIKPGQLRGLVRSFNGKPLAATVRVEPRGTEATTDADGTFQIDLPPGAYDVVIAAPGHASQRRPVRVEENGVTILNADLRQEQ